MTCHKNTSQHGFAPTSRAARAAPTKGRSIQNASNRRQNNQLGMGSLWMFPKNIGFFPQIIHLFIGFSINSTILFGVPLFLETSEVADMIFSAHSSIANPIQMRSFGGILRGWAPSGSSDRITLIYKSFSWPFGRGPTTPGLGDLQTPFIMDRYKWSKKM